MYQDRFNKDKDLEIEHHWFNYKEFFRTCNFDDTEDDIKEAWFFFCEHIMVEVNKNWKNSMLRSNTLMSEVCTLSDEAFARTVLETDLLYWIKKKKPLAGAVSNLDESINVGTINKEDESLLSAAEVAAAKINSKKYYSIYEMLRSLKHGDGNSSDIWNSWDIGYQEKIRVSISSPKRRRSSSRGLKSVTSPSDGASISSPGVVILEEW